MHSPEGELNQSANQDSNVSVELEHSVSQNGLLQEGNGIANMNLGNADTVAKGLSSMLSNIIRDFDSKADDTLKSQSQLSSSLDRLTSGRIIFTWFVLLALSYKIEFCTSTSYKFTNIALKILSLARFRGSLCIIHDILS